MARCQIATVLLAGQYQNGKSTLINCLLGGEYAIEGDGRHTTAYRTVYTYTSGAAKYYKVNADGHRSVMKGGLLMTIDRKAGDVHFEAEIPSPVLKSMSLIDAPGWGVEDADDKQAEEALQSSDFVIYLAQAKQLSKADKDFLRLLKKHRRYFCVVLNARDACDPQSENVQNVGSAIAGALKQIGLDGQYIQYPTKTGVCGINLLWAKYGKHLLDAPKTQREKQQLSIVRSAWRDMDAADGFIDYSEILDASGFKTWCAFLDASLKFAGMLETVDGSEMHKIIATSICNNLIKILKRR